MSERTEKPAFIGVDWGTSSFRAWLFAPSGTVLEDVQGPWGISQIKMTPFRQILLEAVGNWLGQYPDLPIIMCGMIGSAQGWHEAGYLTGTVGVGELAAGAVKVADPELEMYIIPGIKGRSADDYNDVMRGEETLLAGRLGCGQEDKAIFCLPGTHSKWISVEKGRIERLTTFMTGELFHLMKAQSILAPLIDSDSDVRLTSPIFADGLACRHSGQASSRASGYADDIWSAWRCLSTGLSAVKYRLSGYGCNNSRSGRFICNFPAITRCLKQTSSNQPQSQN